MPIRSIIWKVGIILKKVYDLLTPSAIYYYIKGGNYASGPHGDVASVLV